jgi:hypothetical protein
MFKSTTELIKMFLIWFNELIANDSRLSSARILNIFGGIVIASVFIVDFKLNKVINIEALKVIAYYFAGAFIGSKALTSVDNFIATNKEPTPNNPTQPVPNQEVTTGEG